MALMSGPALEIAVITESYFLAGIYGLGRETCNSLFNGGWDFGVGDT
jgi:hypothetical protein